MHRTRISRRCAAAVLRSFLAGVIGTFLLASTCPAQSVAGALTSGIPSLPLAQALRAFAAQTSVQVVYVSELAAGRLSKEVAAGLATTEALTRMLEGTGLRFEFLNSRTVKLLAMDRAAEPARRLRRSTGEANANPPIWPEPLEEIMVTATLRQESLSAVPISAYVLSAAEIDAAGIKDISEIASRVPGLDFGVGAEFGPGILSNLTVRGVSADTGNAPTIAVYMDDVPVQAVHANLSNPYPVTFDLARVEVLRGPQGTLFGSNAQGGAIRFITQAPSATSDSGLYHAEVSASDQGGMSVEAGAALGQAIVPGRLGVRVSASFRSDGGYIDRVDPFNGAIVDRNANDSTAAALRLGLVFQPTDALRLTPSFTYQSTHLHDTPIFYVYLQVPGMPSVPGNGGVFQNEKLLRQPYDDHFAIESLKLEQELGGAEFTAIAAFYDRTAAATVDETNAACLEFFQGCGNPLGPAYPSSYSQAVPTLLGVHQSALSAELRLASARVDSRLSWLAGLFYSRSHENRTRDTYLIADPGNPGIYSAGYAFNTALDGFGHLQLELTRRWKLALGTRFGWRGVDYSDFEAGFANTGAAPYTHIVQGLTAIPPAPRLDVSYQADDHKFYYLTIAKGSRGGGSNFPGQCGTSAVPPTFTSDALWNYELGAKHALFGNRVHVDASIFYDKWNDLQIHAYDACSNSYTANAGLATSSGFDLTADLVAGRFGVRLAVGYVDIHYTETILTTTGQVIADRGDVVGGLPSVPSPWSGALSAQYNWPLQGGPKGYVRADDIFASRNPGPFVENDPNSIFYFPGGAHGDPGTNRLNLQFGMVRAGLDLRLAINNVLDSRPTLHVVPDGLASSLFYAYTFRPRTLTLAATQRF